MMASPARPPPGSPALPQCLTASALCPPGAEPFHHEGSSAGVLILHGLTGSPWEVRPLAEALAAQGFSVAVPILAGHATTVHALSATTWLDWLQSARAALAWLGGRCHKVHLVGLSMGALLAILLDGERPLPRDATLVLMAPALGLGTLDRVALEVLLHLGWPALLGKADPRLPGGVRPPCYHALSLPAMRQLIELMDVVRSRVQPSPSGVLVLHGTRDPTIPFAKATRRARELFGPDLQVVAMEGAGHLLPRTECAPEVLARILSFLGPSGAD